MISTKIKNITLSGTIQIATKTFEMKSNGIDVLDMCAGEPDLPTPQHIKEAAIKAINNNHTKYTINSGLEELRNAVSGKFLREYGANYCTDEIIISTGAKQAVYNSLQAVVSEGDEVLIPLPYYVSYPHMVSLAGGIPKFVKTKTKNSYKLSVEELKESITEQTKAIILCNPNNPTGSVMTKNELLDIVSIAVENNLIVISDEIYEKLIYDTTEFTSVASLEEKFKDNLIIINGVSKAYAMTGWRIGYAVSSKNIVSGMNKLQSHSTSNACTISQYAAIAALTDVQDVVEVQRKIFEERRNLIHNALTEIESLDFIEPHGAFYFFIDIKKILNNSSLIKNSFEFCMKLLNEAHVATVPGSVFGMEGYFRISYSKSKEELSKAMRRIKEAVENFN